MTDERIDIYGLLTRLRAAERSYDARVERHLGIGSTDLAAVRLIAIGEAEGEVVRAVDLATSIGLTSAAISLMLERLARAGYVERLPDPSDGRGRILALTADARDALAETDDPTYAEVRAISSAVPDEFAREFAVVLADLSEALGRRP